MSEAMEQVKRELTPEELEAMETSLEQRDIEVITEEINFYKRQAGSAILEIGKRLAEAKEQLSHGEWLPWLEKEVEFSERSAQQYMRLWREYGKSATVADLGCSKALILLGLPAAEREEFAAETHTVNGAEKTVIEMTRRELEEAIAVRNDARAEAEKAVLEAENARNDLEGVRRELEEAKERMRTLEARPVEVAVEKVDATEEQLKAARKAAEEETRLAMTEEVQKLEEQLKALGRKEKEALEAAEQAKDAAMSYKAEAEAAKKAMAMAGDGGAARFKVLFDQTVENANRMAALLNEMNDSQQEKLRRALLALAEQIRKAAGNG